MENTTLSSASSSPSSSLHQVIIPADDQDQAQYANPMDDPFAEVEVGWKNMTRSNHEPNPRKQYLLPQPLHQTAAFLHRHSNDQVLDQLNQFSFNKLNETQKQPHLNQLILPSLNDTPNQLPVPNSNSLNSHESRLPSSKARKLSLPSPLPITSSRSDLNPSPAMMHLSMRRSDQIGLFRPPSSASASKTSFSTNESTFSHSNLPPPSRTRLSSFSTDLEPISASPTSPNSPYSFPNYGNNNTNSYDQQKPAQVQHPHHLPSSQPTHSSRRSLPPSSYQWLPSSSSSSFSSEDDRLLRRASSSSMASVGSISSSSNSLKARRGLTKPLSLAVPQVGGHHLNSAQALATPLRSNYDPKSKLNPNSAFSRSLPPSPRLGDFGQARDQFVGMKANVTGGFSMKRRTSIPRLTLGANIDFSSENSSSLARSSDPVRLIGRNYENSAMNTPVQLHFDPVAAGEGRKELMSSQAGVGGKGHIEVPSELTESYPYEHGPKEVLPDVFLGSEQNARDGNLLTSMGFGLIINVAKEVECPWEAATSPDPIEKTSWKNSPRAQGRRGLMIRPTASTPNLKRSFEGKIRISLPHQPNQPDSNLNSSPDADTSNRSIEMKHLDADSKTSRPSLDYVKLPWSHDQDGLASIFSETEVFNLIDKARERKLKTLIHCQCGVSRSATFMIGYCMREAVLFPGEMNHSGRMHDAYSFVKEKSPWAGPNMGLIYQLIEYEKVLFKKRGILEEEEDDEIEEEEGLRNYGDKEEENEGPEKGLSSGVEQVEEKKQDDDDQIMIETEDTDIHDHELDPELNQNADLTLPDKITDEILIDDVHF